MNRFGPFDPAQLRQETLRRIEAITGIRTIAYVMRTHNVEDGMTPFIEDSDIQGIRDLLDVGDLRQIDVLIISNGGSPEATERIVNLVRSKAERVRFLIPSNAYSAATMMSFSGDEILMLDTATLGPIDPQINGIPARAILRSVENLEQRFQNENPRALGAYLPLIQKYDLHLLEICKSFLNLSDELARRV